MWIFSCLLFDVHVVRSCWFLNSSRFRAINQRKKIIEINKLKCCIYGQLFILHLIFWMLITVTCVTLNFFPKHFIWCPTAQCLADTLHAVRKSGMRSWPALYLTCNSFVSNKEMFYCGLRFPRLNLVDKAGITHPAAEILPPLGKNLSRETGELIFG